MRISPLLRPGAPGLRVNYCHITEQLFRPISWLIPDLSMSLADIFSISTVTALISTSPSAQTKIWVVLAQCAALPGFIVREGDCLCCGGASCSRAQREHPAIQAPRPVEGVSMSHLLLSCHGKDFQCRSYSGSLDYT